MRPIKWCNPRGLNQCGRPSKKGKKRAFPCCRQVHGGFSPLSTNGFLVDLLRTLHTTHGNHDGNPSRFLDKDFEGRFQHSSLRDENKLFSWPDFKHVYLNIPTWSLFISVYCLVSDESVGHMRSFRRVTRRRYRPFHQTRRTALHTKHVYDATTLTELAQRREQRERPRDGG
jgi:hypothetical protein